MNRESSLTPCRGSILDRKEALILLPHLAHIDNHIEARPSLLGGFIGLKLFGVPINKLWVPRELYFDDYPTAESSRNLEIDGAVSSFGLWSKIEIVSFAV